MRESGDPSAQRDATILSTIQALQSDIKRLERHIDTSEKRIPRRFRINRALQPHEDVLELARERFSESEAASVMDVVDLLETENPTRTANNRELLERERRSRWRMMEDQDADKITE
jgi:hypothetical protein